jgi:Glycosyl transferases group 1
VGVASRAARASGQSQEGDRSEEAGRSEEAPAGAGRHRPLMVAMGSVAVPRGGNETRSRLTAEILADLGMAPAMVTTEEPELTETPAWATSLRAPRGRASEYLSPELARLIRTSSASRTCIIATNPMFMPAIIASRVKLPVIWDTNECQTLHYRRLDPTISNRAKRWVWFLLERWIARRCWMAIAISETEAVTWKSTHPCLDGKLTVVDHATLASPRDPGQARKEFNANLGLGDGPVLLFLGTLRAKQNTAAAKWIVSELAGSLPEDVTILLCGPGSDELDLPAATGARVIGLGAVDDVDSVVAAADICLAPLAAGAGVKTKVLHYLAHGKRVAGTPIAFEGLTGVPGVHSAALDELPELVNLLCRENECDSVIEQRILAQHDWLEARHGREHVTEQWKKVLECLPLPSSNQK